MTEQSVLILGLPGSGKTTFLAALWHLIEAGEAESSFILDRFEGDVGYLNKIAKAWRNFEPVQRTTMQDEQEVVMHMHDRASGRIAAFRFPDLSGETFNSHVEQRRCKPDYLVRCEEADGLLLFVTANKKHDDKTIVEQNRALGPPEEGEQQHDPDGLVRTWAPEYLPTQIRIVEILQFMVRAPFSGKSRRLAIAISAWDVVKPRDITPAKWLERELPLVDQYLKSNQETFSFRIYGVSAQGIDLATGDISTIEHLPASRRILVKGEEAAQHDLTAPIKWLVRED